MAYETAAEKVQIRIADALERIAAAIEESNYRAAALERAQLATSKAWDEASNPRVVSEEIFPLTNEPNPLAGRTISGGGILAGVKTDGTGGIFGVAGEPDAQDVSGFTLPTIPTNEA